MNTIQEIEGTWEEIRAREEEFAGRRVRLQVLEAPKTPGERQPNLAMQRSLDEIERLQQGMRLTPAEDSVALVREARSGGMYGDAE